MTALMSLIAELMKPKNFAPQKYLGINWISGIQPDPKLIFPLRKSVPKAINMDQL